MATLTSTYQYLGRSSAMSPQKGSYSYYILLYGKTVANTTTGIHTVSIKEILASSPNSGGSFYKYATTHSGSIAGTTVFSGSNKPDAAWSGSLTAGGITYSMHTVIGEGSTTVDCTDGKSKNVTLSCTWKFNASGASYTPANGTSRTVSVTATLAAIPRAASADSITCSTKYLDGTITYKYTPKSTSHYIRGTLSLNANGSLISIRSINHGKAPSTSQKVQTVNFTAAELTNIYNKLPNSASGKIRITIYTYSDSGYSTQVGSAAYQEISLTIPTGIQPDATLTVSPINTNAWIKSKGIYVKGWSGFSAQLSGTAKGGASISSYTIAYGNTAVNTKSLSTNKITTSGDIKFTGTVTDSRGRTDSENKIINVLPYSAPAINSVVASRGTYNPQSGWVANDTGSDVRVVFKVTLSLSANGNAYSAAFKLDDNSVEPDYGIVSELQSQSTYTVYFIGIEGEASHTFKITATDRVGTLGNATITIPTINVTMDFHHSGKGVAFGKVAEHENTLDVAWDIKYKNNPIADFVIQQGTSGGWNYRKWESGVAEFWGTFESVAVTKAANIPFNDLFYAGYASLSRHTMLQSVDVVNYSINWTNGYDWCGKTVVSNTKITFYLVSLTDAPDTVQINAHIIGRWK